MTIDQGANASRNNGKVESPFRAGWGSRIVLVLTCVAFLTACSKREAVNTPPSREAKIATNAQVASDVTADSNRKVFEVRGVIQELKGWKMK
jgi:hypothetical protein